MVIQRGKEYAAKKVEKEKKLIVVCRQVNNNVIVFFGFCDVCGFVIILKSVMIY